MCACACERTPPHTQPKQLGRSTHRGRPRKHENTSQMCVFVSCTRWIQRCARAGVCEMCAAARECDGTCTSWVQHATCIHVNHAHTSQKPAVHPPRAEHLQAHAPKCADPDPVRARQMCAGMCDFCSATQMCTRYLRAHETKMS